jgi:Choline dehydrogenase and related flavoproteins
MSKTSMVPCLLVLLAPPRRCFILLLTTAIVLFISKWPHASGLLLEPYTNGTHKNITTENFDRGDIGLPLRTWKKQAKWTRQMMKDKGSSSNQKKIRRALSAQEKKILLDFYDKNRSSTTSGTSVRQEEQEDTTAAGAFPKANHVYDVIIVGAGWSGCSAGKKLIVCIRAFFVAAS